MATQAGAVLEKNEARKPGTALTWGLSLFACAYCLWMGGALFHSTPTFINMYMNMGVDLALSTKIVISFHWMLYPIVFGGTAVLVIAKQFLIREKWANISATLVTVLVASIVSNWITSALYRPLWDLPDKLNK